MTTNTTTTPGSSSPDDEMFNRKHPDLSLGELNIDEARAHVTNALNNAEVNFDPGHFAKTLGLSDAEVIQLYDEQDWEENGLTVNDDEEERALFAVVGASLVLVLAAVLVMLGVAAWAVIALVSHFT